MGGSVMEQFNITKALEVPPIPDLLNTGWKLINIYPYTSEAGELVYARIRLDPPPGCTEGKWIRPASIVDGEWTLKEPTFTDKKPLYKLPQIINNPQEPVFIVEGEKCVDALNKLGIIATTSGAANSANFANWQPLSNRNVIIWPDNDDPGFSYANDVTQRLEKIGCSVQWIDTKALNLSEKEDCFDWLLKNPNMTKSDIARLPTTIPQKYQMEWPELIPLQRPLPPSPEFPTEALGSVLEPLHKKLVEVIQAPAAICGQSLLAGAALATQTYANVSIDGRIYPLSEFFITIAESGERKTAIDSIVLAPHREYQEMLCNDYRNNLLEYNNELEAYNSSKSQALKSKNEKYEEKKKSLNDLGPPPVKPSEPILLAEEPTYEGLIKLLTYGQPSIGLFSDEGGRFIGGHAMNDDNMLKTAAGLCKLWDSGQASRVRSGDGASILFGRRLSCHLMVQPVIAELLLNNSGLQNQGFLSRFFITWPKTKMGQRPYKEVDLKQSVEYYSYKKTMMEIYNQPLPLKAGTVNELEPLDLPLLGETKKLWIKFHNDIESKLHVDGPYSTIKGFANKAAEHAARVAGVLSLTENPRSTEITLTSLQSGIKLVEFYLQEAIRLFNSSFADPELTSAENLYNWIVSREKNEICLQEIYQKGPSTIRNAKTARKLMNILAEHNYIKKTDGTYYNDKYCGEAWLIRTPDK